jgi:adenylate cyclase
VAKPVGSERRLVAILAADVEGYSRLMEADEVATLQALTQRRAILDNLVSASRGRIANTAGDSILAEFGSAVDAVKCAVEAQVELAGANADVPLDRHVNFRIGIHVGDVMIKDGDLFGDGVNIAARLQTLARAGGTCISGAAYDQVRKILPLSFTDLGVQKMKNIEETVRAFAVTENRTAATAHQSSLLLEPANTKPLPLPDKPSIAVLPFTNMSGDPEQDYFADGISEDLITALAHIRWLFVIARNSSFVYRGQAVDVKHVSSNLGVRYILEGSVRKSGNRVRITGQLVDALRGAHHWAERYDRDVTDIFALQDEIVQQVVSAIEPRLLAAEGLRSQTRAPEDLDAWDMVARAMSRYWRATNTDIEAAISILKEAVRQHPDYAPAHSMLAFGLLLAGHLWRTTFEVPTLAADSARRAAELDDRDPWAHLALGYLAFVRRQTREAVAQFRRAIELNPNFAAAYGYIGYPLAFDGQSDEAIANMSLAIRLSPHDGQNPIFIAGIAVAHYVAKRYDQAVEWGRKAVQQGPSITGLHRVLIASLAQAGQVEEARALLARLCELQPELSLAWIERMVPYTASEMPHFLDGMKKAGLT